MNIELKQIIEETLETLPLLKEENIPNIELYMDQVTTLIDKHLSDTRRSDEDKVLTKTMINNYAKNNLLPPPNKKKYSKEHVIMLVLIYYFKNILTINDIGTLFTSVKPKYFQNADGLNMTDIYSILMDMILASQDELKTDVLNTYEKAIGTFSHVKEDEKDELQQFVFIALLCYDIYRKKQLIETIIDRKKDDNPKGKEKEKAQE